MKNYQIYHRDGRAPIPDKESISKIMSANRYKDTKPELILRKHLWKMNIRGYRKHWSNAPGKPDIAFPGRKIAIFVHGCFWHRCPFCKLHTPQSHTPYWEAKFARTLARDKKNIILLELQGWVSSIIWECQIYKEPDFQVAKIKQLLVNE